MTCILGTTFVLVVEEALESGDQILKVLKETLGQLKENGTNDRHS